LKKFLVSVPIFYHFDPERKIAVKTDAFKLVITGVLSQYDDDDDIFHPVAYFSRKQSPVEINSEIYDKELLTIIRTFKEWCPLLDGSPHTLKVLSNYQNLTYFTINCLLNCHQTR
jgi:hypothetical protein